MARTPSRRSPPSRGRISGARILRDVKLAARSGDRTALTIAVDQMKTLALSPRYWERYLALLRNPLARLIDLLVIKQGDRIAHQKGWKLSRRPAVTNGRERRPSPRAGAKPATRRRPARRPRPSASPAQPSLFEL